MYVCLYVCMYVRMPAVKSKTTRDTPKMKIYSDSALAETPSWHIFFCNIDSFGVEINKMNQGGVYFFSYFLFIFNASLKKRESDKAKLQRERVDMTVSRHITGST